MVHLFYLIHSGHLLSLYTYPHNLLAIYSLLSLATLTLTAPVTTMANDILFYFIFQSFHVNCLLGREFTWNVKFYFLNYYYYFFFKKMRLNISCQDLVTWKKKKYRVLSAIILNGALKVNLKELFCVVIEMEL